MADQEPSTPAEIVEQLGLPAGTLQKAKQGEIVVVENDACCDKDLSLIVVNVLDASVDKLREFVVELDKVSELQDATLSTGYIDPTKPSLDEMDLDEATVKDLLKNPFLSKAEVSRVSKASKQGKGAEEYKKVLLERVKAYWEKGLHGIVPYEGKGRDPGADLKHARKAALKIAKDPVVREELQAIPSKSTNESMHKLTWAMQKGNSQAAPVLNHLFREWYDERHDLGFLSVTNRFYSGADYDASQIVVGLVPTVDDKDRSVLFYINRTFTSSVAGFGGSAKRSIGRKLMKSTLVETMTKAKKAAAAL